MRDPYEEYDRLTALEVERQLGKNPPTPSCYFFYGKTTEEAVTELRAWWDKPENENLFGTIHITRLSKDMIELSFHVRGRWED
jgi:hypothetical protein